MGLACFEDELLLLTPGLGKVHFKYMYVSASISGV